MKNRTRTRTALFYLCVSAMCTALIAVCSFFVVPVGNLKYTLQLAAVLFVSGILPPAFSCGSCAAYILLGVVGAPVFAGFTSGIGTITGPTGGFIIGFLPAVFCASLMLKLIKKRTFLKTVGVFSLATLIVYIVGTVGFYMYIPQKGLLYALTTAVFPYLPADAVKILLAAFLSEKMAPVIGNLTKSAE